MRRKRRDLEEYPTPHNEITQPIPHHLTAPLATGVLLREAWPQRFSHGAGNFMKAVVQKIARLFWLAFTVLVILLLTRMALTAFNLTSSIFSQWIFQITEPAFFPFKNLIPMFLYNGMKIDASILVAIAVYALLVNLALRIIRILVE